MPFEGKLIKHTVEGEPVFEGTQRKSDAEMAKGLEQAQQSEQAYIDHLNEVNPDIFKPQVENEDEIRDSE